MRTFVVKMDGEKVRAFNDARTAKLWADKHCKFAKVEIIELREGELPKAGDPRMKPCLDMSHLVYRPFASLS